MKNLYVFTQGIFLPDSKKHFTVKRSLGIFIFCLLSFVQVQAQKTWVGTSSGNWSVAANWSGGTVPVSTDDVVLNPAGARTITVDANYTINNLTVGANTTLTFNPSFILSVNGNFSQSAGTTTLNTGMIAITGNFSQAGGTINLNTGTLDVKGTFSKTTGTFNENTGMLSFTGSAAQTISTNDATRNLYAVTVNNSNGLSIIAPATNLTIANNFTLTNGKLTIGSNTLTLNGTVSGMTAANCLTGSTTSNITIGGTGSLGTLFFDATGAGTTNQVNTFILNRSTSGTISLGNDVNIRTTLTLTNGLINTGSNKVILNSTGTLGRTNGYVNGNLQKYVATGSSVARTFEVGDAANYTPVSISFASVTTAGDVSVSTATPVSSQLNIGSVFLNTTVAVNRYWNLNNVNTLAFTTYNGTFNFVSGDIIGSASTSGLKAGVYNSGWTYPTMGTLNATNSTVTTFNNLGSVILATCLAPTLYSVTGGGAYCSGTGGAAVGLSNSETGVNYQLQVGGVNTGSPVAGTGSAISFPNQTAAGTYTVVATRAATGCSGSMTGSVTISINPLPSLTITGTTTICQGASSMSLNYSTPVNSPDQYSVIWGSAAITAGFTNTAFTTLSGGVMTVGGIQNTSGNFPVDILIKNSTTGCQNNMSSGTVCGTAAENTTLTLSVPNSSTFTGINFASYGTPTGSCGSFATSSCHATNSVSIVQAAAVGTTTFSINATNTVFGDPCSGTVKRLYVEAAYGFSITISPTLAGSAITGPTAVCNGSSITLTASSAPAYSWSTGATTQSITVSPTTNTTYSVTVSNAACSATASQLITVNAIPSVTLGTNTPAVCSGTSAFALSYGSPVNSPDQYSITWSAAGISAGLSNVSNATLSGGVINLSGITSTSGVYGATINIANAATGCSSSISTGSMCGTVSEGSTLSMTAPLGAKFISINFASYGTPTGSCGSFATSSCHAVNSLSLVQAAAVGNTTFSIAASNGVFTDPCVGTGKRLYVDANYSIFSLTVNAIPATPTAGSNTPVCTGNSINLTASTVTGATYAWTGPSSYTSSSQNPTLASSTTTMAGTYSVTSTVAGCTSSGAGSATVVVNTTPAAPTASSNTPVCSGTALNLFASTVSGAIYAWTGPLSYTSTAQNPVISAATTTMAGTYSVKSIVSGCSSVAGTTAVVITAAPSATIAYSSSSYCTNAGTQSVTRTGTAGGTYSAPAALIINSSTGAITPSTSTVGGPYTITYTVAASGGCSTYTTTTSVTILSTPAVTTVSGGGTFCTSATITAAGGSGGTIYFQGTTTGGTSIATASTSQSVTSSGTYYFRSRSSGGCWGTEGSVAVVIKAIPTCTGASMTGNYCSGTAGIVYLAGLVPLSVNTISYSINGTAQTPVSGVTADASGNANFNTVTLTSGMNGQVLRVTNVNNGTCSTTFNYAITLSMNPSNTWLGYNTNWNDPLNWCGTVPAGTANVTFPTGVSFYPVISSGSIQTNNLIIATGASVTVSGGTLKISGSVTNSGTLTASNGTMEFNGTSGAQTTAGSIFANKTIKNLTLTNSSGISLTGTNDTLKISGLVSFGGSNCVLTTNSNLTLLSSLSGNASVGDMTNAGANSGNDILGNVTVEHYIPVHPKAWQFLAVPTSGQTINNAWQEGNSTLANIKQGFGTIMTSDRSSAVSWGFDIQTSSGGTSVKTYNPSTSGWDAVSSTGLPVANKKGYMLFVRGDRSVSTYNAAATVTNLRTTGQLYTKGANAPLSSTVLAGKMESVGNPYASAIDFSLLSTTGSVDSKFYVWDPLLTNNYNGLGGYQTISSTNAWKPVPGGTANYDATVACKTIQSGQAFFVSSSGSGGTVSFTEACKVNGSIIVNRQTNTNGNRQYFRLNMYNAAGKLSDGNVVAFDEDFSNDIDGDDAIKIANSSENIGIKRGDNKLALEARHTIMTKDTVFYTFNNTGLQTYKLKLEPENMESAGLTAILVDKFLHTTSAVSLSEPSTFDLPITTNAASYAPDRLYVVFERFGIVPVTITYIKAAYKNKDVVVAWNVENETSLKQYEVENSVDGRIFTKINTNLPTANNGGSANYQFLHLNPSAADNFYRIKAISLSGLIQYSAIVKVSKDKSQPGITVYPNPVTDNNVQLQFSDQIAGKYSVILVQANGAEKLLTTLQVGAGQATESVKLPQLLPAGIYHLKITDPGGKVILKPIQVISNK